MRRIYTSLALFICTFAVSAQTSQQKVKADSLSQLIARKLAAMDTLGVPAAGQPLVSDQNLLYKLRLDSIQQTVPLTYNEHVQKYIDSYCGRKNEFGKLLSLSTYYFPIFEKALSAYDIPLEIKYLPIIESSMNPMAVSRVGATGIWQFMYATGKGYGLDIDKYIDERRDPIEASYAAAAYFKDAYNNLGDWLLAIAAYNCGMGNVNRAIAKAGSHDFWEIRNYLPQETRNYVPAFIAAVYTMNYAKCHNIAKADTDLDLQTDIIQVKRFVSFADLAKVTNWDETVIEKLNPAYKKRIINGTQAMPKRVILPRVDFVQYQPLYALINNEPDKEMALAVATKEVVAKTNTAWVNYKVQPGQSLAAVANKFKVEVQDIKVWNNLSVNRIVPGQRLKIQLTNQSIKLQKASPKLVSYTVQAGDTLTGIAQKFKGATVGNIIKANDLGNEKLKAGMVLKINQG